MGRLQDFDDCDNPCSSRYHRRHRDVSPIIRERTTKRTILSRELAWAIDWILWSSKRPGANRSARELLSCQRRLPSHESRPRRENRLGSGVGSTRKWQRFRYVASRCHQAQKGRLLPLRSEPRNRRKRAAHRQREPAWAKKSKKRRRGRRSEMNRFGKVLARPFERVGDINVPLSGRNFLVSNLTAIVFFGIFVFALLYTLVRVVAEKLHLVRRLE